MDEELPETFLVHIRLGEREIFDETINRREINNVTVGEWKQILIGKYPRLQPSQNQYLRFIFRGAFMEDHRLVSNYRLCEESTIHVSISPRAPDTYPQNAPTNQTPDVVIGTKPLNFLCGLFLGFLWMLFVTRGEELFDVISTFMLLALTFGFISWLHQNWYPERTPQLQRPHQH